MASVRQGPRRSSGRRTRPETAASSLGSGHAHAEKKHGPLVARFMASKLIKQEILKLKNGTPKTQKKPTRLLEAYMPLLPDQHNAREQMAATILSRLYMDGLKEQDRREKERLVKAITAAPEPPAPLVCLPNMEQTAYMLRSWTDEDLVVAGEPDDEAATIAASILLNQARAGADVPSDRAHILAGPPSPPESSSTNSSRSSSVSSVASASSATTTTTDSTLSHSHSPSPPPPPMTRACIDRFVAAATASAIADRDQPRPSPPPQKAYNAWARAIATRPSSTQGSSTGYFSAVVPKTTTPPTHTVQHGMPSPPQSPTELGSWNNNHNNAPSEMQQQMKLMHHQMQLEQQYRQKQQLQLQQQQQHLQLPLPPALRDSARCRDHAPASLPTPPPSFTASMPQQQLSETLSSLSTTIVTLPPVSTTTTRRGDLLTPVSPMTVAVPEWPGSTGSRRNSPRNSPRVTAAAAVEKRERPQRQSKPRQRQASSSASASASSFSSFSSFSFSSTSPSSSSSSTSSAPTTAPTTPPKRPSLSRPHCNVKYETAELDFILYQRTTKNRAWDDVTAAFNAALPRLRPYADRERGDREARGELPATTNGNAASSSSSRPRPERTTPGLQASYYRQRLALPLLDAAGQLVFDDATGKQVFTEVMVRDDKSRKKSLRRLAASAVTTAKAATTTTASEDTRVHLVLYFPERVTYYDYWFVSEEDKALARQRAYERNLQRTQRGLPPWHPGCDDPETGILIRGKDAA